MQHLGFLPSTSTKNWVPLGSLIKSWFALILLNRCVTIIPRTCFTNSCLLFCGLFWFILYVNLQKNVHFCQLFYYPYFGNSIISELAPISQIWGLPLHFIWLILELRLLPQLCQSVSHRWYEFLNPRPVTGVLQPGLASLAPVSSSSSKYIYIHDDYFSVPSCSLPNVLKKTSLSFFAICSLASLNIFFVNPTFSIFPATFL